MDQETFPQELLKNWEICGKLGDGAMGTVIKVRKLGSGEYGAAKLIHPALLELPSIVKRFMREAIIAQKLGSPFIVTPLEVFANLSDDSTPYIIFEYVAGGTLEALMASKKFNEEQALNLIEKLAEAISFAHSKGVLHRDLKPENILMLTPEHPKVADFGLAALNEQAEKITKTGEMMGTPAYMAPEQLMANKVDERADLYALALIAFELLAGKKPFETTDLLSVIRYRLHGDLPCLRSFAPSVLPPVASLIDKALSKAKEDRPESVELFLKCLKEARTQSFMLAKTSATATLGPTVAELRKKKIRKRRPVKNSQTKTERIAAVHKTAFPINKRTLAGGILLFAITMIALTAFSLRTTAVRTAAIFKSTVSFNGPLSVTITISSE